MITQKKPKQITLKRVVVTGLGALTPIGNTVEEYWNSLVLGVSGASLISHFDTTYFKTKFACCLKNFDPVQRGIPKKEIGRMDPYTLYGVVAADEAIKDAELKVENLDLGRVGVIFGSGIGGLFTFQEDTLNYGLSNHGKDHRTPRFNPFFIPKMIADMAAGMISMKYGFQGLNFATVSACASSTHAIADAFWAIQMGKADVIITGGSEAPVVEVSIGGFNAARALSEKNDDPQTASRPFDQGRDGFVMGEGAGALILEDYEHAIARGAKIYAEIVGAAGTADAYHLTAPHPKGEGAINAMKNALKEAEMSPDEVDYINVHGTSTPLGDIAELKAIQNVFGDHSFKMNISSTKSMTGHLLGAAGAIEAIASILALVHGIIPPTINQFELDPEIDPRFNLTPNQAQKKEVKVSMSNTFGFGGHNASIIFTKINS